MWIAGVDVAFGGGHDAIAVGVDDGDRRLVALQQALGQVVLVGLEGGQPLVGIEEDLTGDPTGDEALPELPLRIDVGVEEVGVAWAVRVVTEGDRRLFVAVIVPWLVTRNDRLPSADLPVLVGIDGLGG